MKKYYIFIIIVFIILFYLWFNNLLVSEESSINLDNAVKGNYPKKNIAIVSYDNRKMNELIEIHKDNLKNYARKHNYTYLFLNKYENKLDLPVYWKKIQIVKDLLNDYDYVLWMDTDAFVIRQNIPLEYIISLTPSKSIFIGKDHSGSRISQITGNTNAGAFMIKNNPIGHKFLEDCINYYTSSTECLVNGKLGLKGKWAGMCYEQGVMNHFIRYKYKNDTNILSTRLIFNDYYPNFDSFITHIYGDKKNALQYMKDYIATL